MALYTDNQIFDYLEKVKDSDSPIKFTLEQTS